MCKPVYDGSKLLCVCVEYLNCVCRLLTQGFIFDWTYGERGGGWGCWKVDKIFHWARIAPATAPSNHWSFIEVAVGLTWTLANLFVLFCLPINLKCASVCVSLC